MAKTLNATIGSQIRELREAAGLTQGELAELAELSQQHVSGLERDLLCPTIDTLCRLADALKADWGYDGQQIIFRPR